MGTASSVSAPSKQPPMPLLLASPKCAWLKHLAGTGISLNLRGKEYKSKGKGWSGRGCAVGFGSAASASQFVADGNLHSMAVRVANDRNLALEIGFRKFEVGAVVSVWFNDGHPEYACRFTVNADHSLTPLDNSGKPQKHLAIGIKKGTSDAILVRIDDAEQKVTFSFGEDMSSRLSDISKVKEQAKAQMKELHNFPLLLLSPACDSVGQGMKALYVDNNEWKDKKSRGRMVSIGMARNATYFSADGSAPTSIALRVHKDDGLALHVSYNKVKAGTRICVYDSGEKHRWANTFCVNFSDGTISPIDSKTNAPSDLVLGVDQKSMGVVLVSPKDERRIVIALGEKLKNFRNAVMAQKRKEEEKSQALRLKAVKYVTPSFLSQLREDGYIKVTGLVSPELISRALGEINRKLGQASNVDMFKAKTFPSDPAITDLFNRSGIPHLIAKLLGMKNLPRQTAGQIALRFPGDACPGNALMCSPAHFDNVRKYWHIDGCPSDFVKGVTDHYGKVANFDILCGVLLSDVDEEFSGELCCYPGSHMVLADYFKKRGRLEALRKKGAGELPTGDKTDTLFTRPAVNCIGKAGSVFLANYMTAHFIAPNRSAKIRYAVYFRVQGPSFVGKTHNPAPMLSPWVNWPVMAPEYDAHAEASPKHIETKSDSTVNMENILAAKVLSMHYAKSNNDHLSFMPPAIPNASASGALNKGWVCSQCTFNHSDPSQFNFLVCAVCGVPRSE